MYQTNSYGRSFAKEYLDGPNRKDSNRPSSGYYGRGFNPQADAVLTYLNLDGDHNLDVKVGMSYLQRDNISLSASECAATDLIPTLNASADPKMPWR